MAKLELEDVCVQRAGKTVLEHVTVSIQTGETLVILGPSGGGKSSLLRVLNRLDELAAGSISLDGQDITELPVQDLRRRVSMVFQKTAVFAGSVADNIRYGPKLCGQQLSDDDVLKLMQQASLEPSLLNADASKLSGGQEQRLAIARALATAPDMLLLDEPTSALDPVATHDVENALHKLRSRQDVSLVWVSHDVEQAARVADRVIFLDGGRVAWLGPASEMLTHPALEAFAQGLHDDDNQAEPHHGEEVSHAS
ncbi:MAG: phosphate ABC transporter ATP-binding protein [Deinococcota bacterium]